MPDLIELEGKLFIPADQMPLPEWGCMLRDRLETTLSLKDDDLFLISDTLGNISSCGSDGALTSLGLFCRDTRFLSRLELQIEGRSPILLSSNAQKGFALSVLCANPAIDDRIPTETIGIQRELAINGGLFEEITLTNYSTQGLQFELSLSFDADFVDLFEVRGHQRQQRGKLLRRVEATVEDPLSVNAATVEGSEASSPDPEPYALPHPQSHSELTMAYQGLDGAVMESHIQFLHHPPITSKAIPPCGLLN
ncbi:glycogen debranching N-terminal domain-containing protein [Neosynechococcus sphagnicola]|uniref:glycogen debranching N-terminal domain-containing protein n=1 Tax=Neosynechococcus sphagnicola TaxID=1501145 RepID=UPI000AC3D10E|nr:glycogen debranching N-terminal domain-containing protein [Neosynechococcus sphagnicola]